MKNLRVNQDGFMMYLVSKEFALFIKSAQTKVCPPIYKLYDDGTESLVEDKYDILRHDGKFGLEIGFIQEAVSEYKALQE